MTKTTTESQIPASPGTSGALHLLEEQSVSSLTQESSQEFINDSCLCRRGHNRYKEHYYISPALSNPTTAKTHHYIIRIEINTTESSSASMGVNGKIQDLLQKHLSEKVF